MSPSLTDVEYLKNARLLQTRAPLRVFETAQAVLKGKSNAFAGDEECSILEQQAMAALDLGRAEAASDCILRLSQRFPDSPRIRVLEGMLLEVLGKENEAKAHYEKMLKTDETSILALRRLMSLPSLKIEERIRLLLEYLDTFYTDIDGWALLSELYSSLGLYTPALASLAHPLLLAPQNPLNYLRHAETAYTMGDLPLAFKDYLLALSASERPETKAAEGKGLVVRAWWGLKLTTRALLAKGDSTIESASGVLSPSRAEIEEFDLLSTKWLAKMYAGKGVDESVRKAVLDGFL